MNHTCILHQLWYICDIGKFLDYIEMFICVSDFRWKNECSLCWKKQIKRLPHANEWKSIVVNDSDNTSLVMMYIANFCFSPKKKRHNVFRIKVRSPRGMVIHKILFIILLILFSQNTK